MKSGGCDINRNERWTGTLRNGALATTVTGAGIVPLTRRGVKGTVGHIAAPRRGKIADMDTFLDAAEQLLAIQSTADNPRGLAHALEFVLDFTGPGFTVERFVSAGKPSALLYTDRKSVV